MYMSMIKLLALMYINCHICQTPKRPEQKDLTETSEQQIQQQDTSHTSHHTDTGPCDDSMLIRSVWKSFTRTCNLYETCTISIT